jgi:teichuronic acid biosynthesis glycosyltransferase TuaC
MRVLTLTPFYPSAADDAMGCFIAEPIRALQGLNVDSCVFAVQPFYRPPSSPNGHPAQWVRYAAIPGGIGLASSGVFLYANLLSRVRQLHQQCAIDLIHAHAALPCGQAAALLSRQLGIPFVLTVHGLDVFFLAQVKGHAGQWCKRASQSVYQRARRVICVSRRIADEIANGCGDKVNLTVIHNGVDPQQFRPAESDPEPTTILSIGNLNPTKGHELLLRAFADIAEQYPNIRCEIIGDGSEHSRLMRLAHSFDVSDRVQFLGRQSRSQVAEAMRRCTIFALPSRYEGLGCVYLEAMSAEKPAIACRRQGIEDLIDHGQNGWLIDPDDPQGLTQALIALLGSSDLRARIGTAARRSILNAHTLAHQADRLAQLYRDCLA